MFFEELPDYEPGLTLNGRNQRIATANHPLRPASPSNRATHENASPGHTVSHPIDNQLRPPIAIKELLRRAANQSPIARILIPM